MAAHAELIGITRNPVPNGAVAGTFTARDGLSIRYARWDTTAARRLGTVCLFQGRTEFIEKYFETITDLRRRGFAVATMDWRGQGGSSRLLKNPLKGHVESFAQHDADVVTFMSEIVLPDCPPPYYCLAHSMGGHLVLRLTQTKACWWDRIVLDRADDRLCRQRSQECGQSPIVAEIATFFGLGDSYIPRLEKLRAGCQTFEGNVLTSDRLRFERARDVDPGRATPWPRSADPGLGHGRLQLHVAAINSVAFMESVKVPVLIVAAGNDQIVSTPAIERFASRIKNCTHIVLAGSHHEILQERDQLREQFWAAFDAYIPGSSSTLRSPEHAAIAL